MGSAKHICFKSAPNDGCLSSSAVPLLMWRESLVFHMLARIMGERQKKNGNRCQLFQRENKGQEDITQRELICINLCIVELIILRPTNY